MAERDTRVVWPTTGGMVHPSQPRQLCCDCPSAGQRMVGAASAVSVGRSAPWRQRLPAVERGGAGNRGAARVLL